MSLSLFGAVRIRGAVRLSSVDTYLALPGCLAVFDPRSGFILSAGRFVNLTNLASPSNSLFAPVASNGHLAVTDTSTFGGVTAGRQALQSLGSNALNQATLQLSQLHKEASTVYTVYRISSAPNAANTVWTTAGTGTPGVTLTMNTSNCNLVASALGAAGGALFSQIARAYAYFVGDVILVVQRLTGPRVNTAVAVTTGTSNTSTRTFVTVNALPAAIAAGTVLAFLNGTVVTVAAGGAAAGATTINIVGTIGATIPNATSAGAGQGILTTYAPTTNVSVITSAAAAAGATTLAVQPLSLGLWSGYSLPFPGVNAVLNAPAAIGATSLSVNALSGAIASGATAARVHGGVVTNYASRSVVGTTTLDQSDSVAYRLLGGSGSNNVLLQVAFSDAGLSTAALAARDARMLAILRSDFANYQFSSLL